MLPEPRAAFSRPRRSITDIYIYRPRRSITPFKVQFESLRADNLHVSSGYKPVGVSINFRKHF